MEAETVPKKRNFASGFNLFKTKAHPNSKLRDFIIKSKKYQTLYANSEGCYSRRVVNLKDVNILKHFIYCTMYYDEVHDWQSEQTSLKQQHIEQILEKIITISKNFDLKEEIHFGIVWVYYYSYENEIERAIPVFKIFKRKSGNEAVFLDASLTFYKNWAYFLDCAEFPRSLLCVPRQGEYCFSSGNGGEDKELDLEFVCSKRSCRLPNVLLTKGFTPFFTVAFHSMWKEIECIIPKNWELIKKITCLLWYRMKKTGPSLINVAVFGLFVFLYVKNSKMSLKEKFKSLSMDSFMLLNQILKEDFLDSLLTSSCSSNPLKTFPSEFSTSTDLYQEAMLLVKLLREPQKDWKKILGSFCSIFKKNLDFLFLTLSLTPTPQLLKDLLYFVIYGLRMINNGSEISKSQELVSSTLFKSANTISNSQLSKYASEIFHVSKSSDQTTEAVETSKTIGGMAIEKVLSNLSLLETTSSAGLESRLVQELVEKSHENLPPRPPGLDSISALFLSEDDGYGIFLMQHASLPQLTSVICGLIGRGFFFKPEETINTHNVILKSGKIAGTIFFLSEYFAVGLFILEAIRKQKAVGDS